jgi:hypothetical protein
MLRLVALVITDVSDKRIASIIRVTSIGERGRTLAVTIIPARSSPILVTLMMEAMRSSRTSVLAGATRSKIPEHDILYSHRRENLKSYIALTGWAL